MQYPVWIILFSETGRNEGFWLVCNLYRSLSCLHVMLRLIMSVAMTPPPPPPLYTFMTWTGTTLVLQSVKVLKLQVLTVVGYKWEGVVGTGWSWLRIGTGGGHL